MDNQFSQPALLLPAIPSDFESKAGSSRVDFARALFSLLASARITGINPTSPQPYDLTTLQAAVEELQASPQPKFRSILKDGVANASIIVPFADIGTEAYFVNVVFVTPDTNINTVTWSVVDDSQQSDQVTIRIDGDASTYGILVNIIEKVN